MRTTLAIPDVILCRARTAAAERGIPLSRFVAEALREKLKIQCGSEEKPWMKSFGKLRLRKETARINRLIEDEFEPIQLP